MSWIAPRSNVLIAERSATMRQLFIEPSSVVLCSASRPVIELAGGLVAKARAEPVEHNPPIHVGQSTTEACNRPTRHRAQRMLAEKREELKAPCMRFSVIHRRNTTVTPCYHNRGGCPIIGFGRISEKFSAKTVISCLKSGTGTHAGKSRSEKNGTPSIATIATGCSDDGLAEAACCQPRACLCCLGPWSNHGAAWD